MNNNTVTLTTILNGEQAKKEMEILNQRAMTLRKTYDDLVKAGDYKQAEGINKQLKETEKSMRQLNRSLIDVDKVLGNLSTAKPKELNQVIGKLNRLLNSGHIERGSKEWDELTNKISRARNELKKINSESGVSTGIFGRGGALAVFAGNIYARGVQMLGQMVAKARDFVKQGVEMAAQAQGIDHAFSRIANKDYLAALRKQTKGLISDFTLMKSAVRADNFNIPLGQLGKMLEFAQNRARDTGESVDYLVESIVNGIGRKSPLILDNLGISTVRLQQEVKKTGDFASAVGKIIEEEMAKAGPAIDTAQDAATRKKVAWENLQLATGKFFLGFRSGWDNFTTRFAEGLTKILSGKKDLIKAYDDQIEKVSDLQTNLIPLLDEYEELKSKTELSKDEHTRLSVVMKSLSDALPGIISEWDEYGNIVDINTGKVYEYIKAEKLRLQYMNKDAIAQAEKDKSKAEKKLAELGEHEDDYRRGYFLGDYKTGPDGRRYRPKVELSDKWKQWYEAELLKWGNELKGSEAELERLTGSTWEKALETSMKMREERKRFNEMNKEELEKWIKDEKNAANEYLSIAQKVYNSRFAVGLDDSQDKKSPKSAKKKEEDPLREREDALKKSYDRQLIDLKKSLLDKRISDEEYQRLSYIAEIEHLSMMLEARRGFGADTSDVEMQITDKMISEANRRYKLAQDLQKEMIDGVKTGKGKHREEAVDEDYSPQSFADEKMMLDLRREYGMISEEEYQQSLYDLREEYLEKYLAKYLDVSRAVQDISGDLSGAIDGFQRAEEMSISRKYDKMIKAAGNNSKKVAQLEEEKEKAIHDVRAKYADKQFIITVANVIATTATAAMESYKAMAGIPVVGPALGAAAAAAAVLYGAGQIAVAKQQRDAAKEGYADGGYTRRGNWWEEDGAVHKGEFVGNRFAVANPAVRKVFDVVDQAQRSNTVGSLSDRDFQTALNYNEHTQRRVLSEALSGFNPINPQQDDGAVVAALHHVAESSKKLRDKLDEPIVAETYIEGKGGSKQANDLYNRMKKNVSRS